MRHLHGMIEFFAVVENGGFSAAAKKLNVSTSYVSRRVADLEARLSTRLLHRTTRRVNLTDLGSQYYEQIRDILRDIEALESNITEQQNLVKGSVRITAGGLYGETAVSSALVQFAKLHPAMSIHLEITDRRVDLIREGYDLAIRHGMPVDADLIARPISQRFIKVCASPEFLTLVGTPQHPQDLVDKACIGIPGVTWQFNDKGKTIDVKISGPWSSNNGPAIAIAAVQGLGFAMLSETYIVDYVRQGLLVPVLTEYELPPQKTYLVYPTRELVPFRIRALIDFLVENLMNPHETDLIKLIS